MLYSRKFKALLLDTMFSTMIYFATVFLSPEHAEHVLWLIAAWQPVVIAFVLGTAWEDAAQKGNSFVVEVDGTDETENTTDA